MRQPCSKPRKSKTGTKCVCGGKMGTRRGKAVLWAFLLSKLGHEKHPREVAIPTPSVTAFKRRLVTTPNNALQTHCLKQLCHAQSHVESRLLGEPTLTNPKTKLPRGPAFEKNKNLFVPEGRHSFHFSRPAVLLVLDKVKHHQSCQAGSAWQRNI